MKQDRLEARMSPEQAALIAAAARVRGQSRSSFVVEAAVERADTVLLQHSQTTVAWSQAEEFLSWFDRPAEVVPELKRLAHAPQLEHR